MTRLIADGIDFGIVVLIELGILVSASVARYLLVGGTFTLWRPPVPVTSTFGYAVTIAYLAFGWATTGRSPGKQLAGLRLIVTRGRRWVPGRMVLRAAICVAFPIGLLWVIVSRRNSSLQDLILGTAVIYDWPAGGDKSTAAETGARARQSA